MSIQPLSFVHFEINKTQNIIYTYITYYHILGQIGDLRHVVEILSMAFPRKKKKNY